MTHQEYGRALDGSNLGIVVASMLANPSDTFGRCALGLPLNPRGRRGRIFGCNRTLAGHGCPFTRLIGPQGPVSVDGSFTGDVGWQEVAESPQGGREATGHRIADIDAPAGSMEEAIAHASADIRRIRSLGRNHRTDVGRSLWPPGNP